MKSISKIQPLIIGLVLSLNCFGQQTFEFLYDDNGNREHRNIIPLHAKSTASLDSSANIEFKEMLGEMEINLFPNPTRGEINIEFKNLPGDQTTLINVYDFLGSLLKSTNNLSSTITIDLSELPSATYVIEIIAGNKRTEWKVIKE